MTYVEMQRDLVSQWSGYLVDICRAMKNAFVGFVYDPAGGVSSQFVTALGYIVLSASIVTIVMIARLIFKKGYANK